MQDLRQTANRVRIALYLGIETFDKIAIALEIAESKSVFLIEEVEKDLTELENLSTVLTTELSSPNSALTQADVLRFAEGQRAKGMIILQYNLIQKLANTLGLRPNLEIVENIAAAMGFTLGNTNSLIFGQIQRS